MFDKIHGHIVQAQFGFWVLYFGYALLMHATHIQSDLNLEIAQELLAEI
jgi:hypothetical protein